MEPDTDIDLPPFDWLPYESSFGQDVSAGWEDRSLSVGPREIDNQTIDNVQFTRRYQNHHVQPGSREAQIYALEEGLEDPTDHHRYDDFVQAYTNEDAYSGGPTVSDRFRYTPANGMNSEIPGSTPRGSGPSDHGTVYGTTPHRGPQTHSTYASVSLPYNRAQHSGTTPASRASGNLPDSAVPSPDGQPYSHKYKYPESHGVGSVQRGGQFSSDTQLFSGFYGDDPGAFADQHDEYSTAALPWREDPQASLVTNPAYPAQTMQNRERLGADPAASAFYVPDHLASVRKEISAPTQQRIEPLGATKDLGDAMDFEQNYSVSRFLREPDETGYLQNIRQTRDLPVASNDAAFAGVAPNGPVTSFHDPYAQQEALKWNSTVGDFGTNDFTDVQQYNHGQARQQGSMQAGGNSHLFRQQAYPHGQQQFQPYNPIMSGNAGTQTYQPFHVNKASLQPAAMTQQVPAHDQASHRRGLGLNYYPTQRQQHQGDLRSSEARARLERDDGPAHAAVPIDPKLDVRNAGALFDDAFANLDRPIRVSKGRIKGTFTRLYKPMPWDLPGFDPQSSAASSNQQLKYEPAVRSDQRHSPAVGRKRTYSVQSNGDLGRKRMK